MYKNWSSPINLTVVSGAPGSQSVHYVEAAALKEKAKGADGAATVALSCGSGMDQQVAPHMKLNPHTCSQHHNTGHTVSRPRGHI